MKKILWMAFIAIAITSIGFRAANEPLAIGSALPRADVKMMDVNGKEVNFNDAKKKNGLLVMFSCNTCPVVHKYQSRTLEITKYAAGKDVGVILLNSNNGTRANGDSYDDMKDYAKAQNYTFHYVVDEKSAMADVFGANRTPEVFLFDGKGLLAYHGAIDDNSGNAGAVTRKHLQIALDELAAGKEISTKETKSVGCTIKR